MEELEVSWGGTVVHCSAKWWEQSWQDMVGNVKTEGLSSRSDSSRQKVEGSGVVERQWGSSDVLGWWRSAGW